MHIWQEEKNQQRPKLWGVYDWGRYFFFIWFFSCCLYGIEKLKVLLWRITIPDMAQFTTLSMLSEDVWWRWQSVMEHTNYVMYKLPSNLLRTLCEKINAIILGIYCRGHSRWNASCIFFILCSFVGVPALYECVGHHYKLWNPFNAKISLPKGHKWSERKFVYDLPTW